MSFKYESEFTRAVTRDSVRAEELQEANIAKLRKMISKTMSVVRSASTNSIKSLHRKSESLSSIGSHVTHSASRDLIETEWASSNHRTSKENISVKNNLFSKKTKRNPSAKRLAPKFSEDQLDLSVIESVASHDSLFSPCNTVVTQAEILPDKALATVTRHNSISLATLVTHTDKLTDTLSPVSYGGHTADSSKRERRQMQCFTPKDEEEDEEEAPFKPPSEPRPPDEEGDFSDSDHEIDVTQLSHESSTEDVDAPSPTLSRPTPSLKRQGSLSMPSSMPSISKNISQLRSPRGLFQHQLPSKLRVFVTTFNTAGNIPRSAELHNWLPLDPEGLCDLIVIGLQECKSGNSQRTELKAAKSSMRVRKASQDMNLDEFADQLDRAQPTSPSLRRKDTDGSVLTTPKLESQDSGTPDTDPPSLSRGLSRMFAKLTSPKAKTIHFSPQGREVALRMGEQLDREASNQSQSSGRLHSGDRLHSQSSMDQKPSLQRRPSVQESMYKMFTGKSKSVRLNKVNRAVLNQMIEQELQAVAVAEGRTGIPAAVPSTGPDPVPQTPELKKTLSSGSMKRRPSTSAFKRATSSFIPSSSKKNQIDKTIIQHYGPGYKKVACEALGDMRLLVLCRTGLKQHVSSVKKTHKATGIGGVLGNKGGVMVKVKVANTQLCFLSCHLAAHESEDKVNRRNQDVHDILKAASNASKQHLDIAQRYHHTFLFGDLNYRINLGIRDQQSRDCNLHRLEVVKLIYNGDYESLYKADQLQREISANNVLRGFRETPPQFAPTFKVTQEIGLEYNLHRIPSYCDRILWTSLPGLENRISQNSYYSVDEVASSDHKPVCSIFTIESPSDYSATLDTHRPAELSPRKSMKHLSWGGSAKRYALRVSRVKALNVSDEMYSSPFLQLKIHSSVLGADMFVTPTPPGEQEGNFLVDMWFDVPQMPIKGHSREHLAGKHLAMTLWGDKKCRKLMGQCVLSLDAIAAPNSTASIFHFPLLRYGVACGEISGVYELIEITDGQPHVHSLSKRLSKSISKSISGELRQEGLLEAGN